MIGYISMPGGWELLIIAVLFLIPLGGAVVRYFCARIVGISQPTFLRALGCAILAPLANILVWLLLLRVPVVGPALALIVNLLIDGMITRAIFRTTYARALAAVALTWAIQAILVAIVSWLLALAGLTPIRDSGMEDETASLLLPADLQSVTFGLPSYLVLACSLNAPDNACQRSTLLMKL